MDELERVDEETGLVYFSGRKDTPLERHLYSTPLAGGEISKITQRPGFHSVEFSKDSTSFIDNYSSAVSPPQVSLHKASGERLDR